MHKLRIQLLLAGVFLVVLVIFGQLFFIQIVKGDEYRSYAEGQYVQRNYHLYDRGDIYFQTREGHRVSAATLQTGYLLAIDPQKIDDPEKAANELATVIELDTDRFIDRYKRGGRYQEVASYLSEEDADSIRDLELSGVALYPEQWRYYPGEENAAHLLGFTGFQEDEQAGRYGLERMYEDVLDRPDSVYTVNFFAELFGSITQGFSVDARDDTSGDIVTTIEPTVQSFLERALEKLEDEWGGSEIGGIIIDPNTGAVRAMASRPTFDPNTFSENSSDTFSNRLVERVHEMGSVVKPLTLAAGIDAGIIEPDSTYIDRGSEYIDGFRISNFDGRSRGEITMQDVLNESVNTGVVHVMDEMGTEVFADYMRSFGFDSKTGIDLPSESDNLLRNFDSPRRIEFATASFGQGIAVTPVGMTRALAALGNGGKVVQPYIVETIERENGEVVNVTPEEHKERVISEESSRSITRMLVNTVDEALLGGDVALDNYSVAAKTGTAQIPHSDERGYREDAFLHSFFGYFPAHDPEFLVFLYHTEPKQAQYASQTLTHSFMDLTSFLIQYYGIGPDR